VMLPSPSISKMKIKLHSTGEVVDLPIYNSKARTVSPAVYLLKYLPSEVRAYTRGYALLGTVVDSNIVLPRSIIISTWKGYDGGSDGVKGNAVWLDAKRICPSSVEGK
jgi:hypothetical protein